MTWKGALTNNFGKTFNIQHSTFNSERQAQAGFRDLTIAATTSHSALRLLASVLRLPASAPDENENEDEDDYDSPPWNSLVLRTSDFTLPLSVFCLRTAKKCGVRKN